MPIKIFPPQMFFMLTLIMVCSFIILYLVYGEKDLVKGILGTIGIPLFLFILWSAVRQWLGW